MTPSERSPRSSADVLADTVQAQLSASDPAASAWVSANAGAGKTHVLKMRVLRLLLAGAAPDRILCLTYTKAAASEMSTRVFADLARFATCSDDDLTSALAALLARAPTEDERKRARELFASAIETPGGLKIQTIHAFAERLLQRFPLEAGVPPGFQILDEETSALLRREAIDSTLMAATRDPDAALGRALLVVVAFATGDAFDGVLAAALSKREWLDQLSRLALGAEHPETQIDDFYRRLLDIPLDASAASLVTAMANVVPWAELQRLRDALTAGSKSDGANAVSISAALTADASDQRAEALAEYFLTGKGEPRARLATKAVVDRHPDLAEVLARAQSTFVKLSEQRRSVVLADATASLARIADAVLQRYSDAKARRAALDFDDLIVETERLLATAESAEWVLYKLDGGLDHVLVDEAQDTSARQWAIVESLAREFFTGSGARDLARTLFAVGDEKQSIYSFQGAAPKMFAETGARFRDLARQANQPWRVVPLTLSFRSAPPVLEAVDRAFADAVATPGLSAAETAVRHVALRQGHAGLVELWPTETWTETEAADAFAPLSETAQGSPAVRLAERIADTIQAWLASGETLASEGRPITPGDIVVLVRKRRPFAIPMVSALKRRQIPVAGADRIALLGEIAVQDLMALGDFLVLPEDDLALAAVLKSPIFDLDDDDLLTFAPGRPGALWKALLAAAKTNPRLAPAAEALKGWRARADFLPPYEFFASLLDAGGLRTKMLARLGPDAADPIDEFVNLALGYDEGEPPSLQGFLDWLRTTSREIKRDMEHGRNAVRVMTVHAAKGLEAPIVFLPDTCASPSRRRPGELVRLQDVSLPPGADAPFAWPVKGTSTVAALKAGATAAQREEQAEHNRLLYVAMTRARDRLYVGGFEGRSGRARGCWYDIISAGLDAIAGTVTTANGASVRRYATAQSVPVAARQRDLAAETSTEVLPDWATRPARSEPQLTMPLAPSRLAPYDIDDEGEPTDAVCPATTVDEPTHPSPRQLAGEHRFLRGTLTHALLEHLPMIPGDRRTVAAAAFVDLRGAALPAHIRASIAAEALAVISDPAFAAVFGVESRAEVPIVAEIPPPPGRGLPLKLMGQIDRLAVLGNEVLVVDYKTNRPPPTDVAATAPAYLFQLAAYRLALAQIYPGKTVRAAILWTDGARLMPIPDAMLDEYAAKLWTLERVA
jgi:ATP-dependent helicase/nuclease subunit A